MINYKEKYLKYKKKYLKIRKMFGGSGSGLSTKKVPTYDKVPLNMFDPIKPYSIKGDPLFQDPRKRIVDIEEDNKKLKMVDAEPPDDWRYDEALLRLDKQLAKLEGNPEILKIDGKPPEEKPDLNRFGRKYNKDNKNNKDTLLFGGGILIAAITSVVLLLK